MIRYRVFTHRQTGRKLPVLYPWSGEGTPSSAYIPELAQRFHVRPEDVEASDQETPPDLSVDVLAETPPAHADPWAGVYAAYDVVKANPSIPPDVITLFDEFLKLLPTGVVIHNQPHPVPPSPGGTPPGALG
jgi:hypothetical protein